MIDVADAPGFATYALCVAILALKMLASAVYTGTQRTRNRAYVNAEDARVFGKGAVAEPAEHPVVAHALRIQRNDGENIPVFFALGLVYVLSGASAGAAAFFCWTFTLSRIAHTIAYTLGLQPWRGLFFAVGTFALICMALQIIF